MLSDKPATGHETEARLLHILGEVRRRGHRVTPQRVAIIRNFLNRSDHPSAEGIYRALKPEFPMMALSTVYATLKLLMEVGEAVDVAPAAEHARFDPVTGEHCHLICLRCGSIRDLPFCPGAGDPQTAEHVRAAGFVPTREMHEVFGLCAVCRNGAS
ncbi:MAG: transcriptional repressor [Armatimonadetes bacterium]|nr:transcriptional repressor [Armatimonadota bacterium]